MAPVAVYSDCPINPDAGTATEINSSSTVAAKPVGITPQTAAFDSFIAVPTTTAQTGAELRPTPTTALEQITTSPPPPQPGVVPALPAPTATATPTVCSPYVNLAEKAPADAFPPPPQPGATPCIPPPTVTATVTRTVIVHARNPSLPPPRSSYATRGISPVASTARRSGSAHSHRRRVSAHAFHDLGISGPKPATYLPQSSYASLQSQISPSGTAQSQLPPLFTDISNLTQQSMHMSASVSPSSDNGERGGSLTHPPGYSQDPYAASFSPERRAAYEAAVVEENSNWSPTAALVSGDLWDTVTKWAGEAGKKLGEVEQGIWKVVGDKGVF